MNIPNPYFQGVPDVGDLEFKYCFYSLNRPMLFVCTDNNKRIDGSRNYYLCSCYELTKSIGWIIAKISKDLLLDMINNNVSLRDTFNQCTKKYVAVFTAGDKYEKVVVGTGCPTCKQLYALTLRAASRIGNEARVEYVAEAAGMKRLMELGLMRSPALVVDGKIAMVGYEPNIEGIKEKILEAAR
jgi:hypothetical protein